MQDRLTHLYFGEGKGKTTAAMGLALRALGNDWRVVIVQFLKGTASGEVRQLQKLGAIVLRDRPGTKFVWDMTEQEKAEAKQMHNENLHRVLELVADQQVDLLVLDEIGSACQLDLVDEELVRELVQNKPANLELVLTAHQPKPWMMESADYVTEMLCHKHPYEKGISARKGIEF